MWEFKMKSKKAKLSKKFKQYLQFAHQMEWHVFIFLKVYFSNETSAFDLHLELQVRTEAQLEDIGALHLLQDIRTW